MLCGAGEWAPAALPRVSHGVHDRALYSGLSGLQRGGHSLRLRNGNRTDKDLYNDKKFLDHIVTFVSALVRASSY